MRYSLFAILSLALSAQVVLAQRPLPLTVTDSSDGPLYAVAIWQNKIFVGGRFGYIDSLRAQSIAVKDSGHWQPLGAGVHGTVLTMCIDSTGGVYVGGIFDSVGGIAANNVAHWDGQEWHALDGGVNDTVFTVMLDRDTLYVGGTFDTVNARHQCAFARWKATLWDTTDNEVESGAVHSIIGNAERKIAIAGSVVITSKTKPISMILDNLPIAKLRGGDNVPEIHSVVFHRHGVLANGPDIFSQLAGSAEELYSRYLASPTLHGAIVGLHYYDGKRFVACGSFDMIAANRDTFASFYDGAGWRAFSPHPPSVCFASENAGRTLYLTGGDSVSGYVAQSYYKDSIGMGVQVPTSLPTGSQFLEISVRADGLSNDSLAVVLKNAAYGWPELDPSNQELHVAPGLERTARFSIYVHPIYKGDAVVALFSNSSSQSDPILHVKMESTGSVAALASLPDGTRYDAASHSLLFDAQPCRLEITLFDIGGRPVDRFTIEPNSDSISFADLAPGLYFYREEKEGSVRTGKILIY